MSQETSNTPASTPSKELVLTPDLVKTLASHDQIRWVGPTGMFTWTEQASGYYNKPTQTPYSVHLVKDKVYTLMRSPRVGSAYGYSNNPPPTPRWVLNFMRKTVKVTDAELANWTLVKTRHDEIVQQEKQKRAWTMASKTFPKIRSMFSDTIVMGRNRVQWDLKDLELSKKMELLSKLTTSELGLLEFLENDSKNPHEDVKRLFEIYHLYTSQQNEEKSV